MFGIDSTYSPYRGTTTRDPIDAISQIFFESTSMVVKPVVPLIQKVEILTRSFRTQVGSLGQIITQIKRPSRMTVDKIAQFSVSSLHECMGKRGQMNHEIKPIDSDMKVCGTSITVDCPVADNLTLHKAIEVAAEGDVLVVDAKGNKEAGGMWGEIMTIAAQTKGIRGIVIDGAVRDVRALLDLRFPTFASAISPGGTIKKTLGSINTPIVCGGVAVHPGDVVVGDADGVVVVPMNLSENLITKAEQRENAETEIKKRLRMGETTMKIYGFDQLLAGENVGQRRS